MKNYLILSSLFLTALLPHYTSAERINSQISSPTLTVQSQNQKVSPLYIYIPSIHLYTSVESVGTTTGNKMDVPSGRTNLVGWYKYGVIPGKAGTAVFDAHNTAAFKDLKNISLGDDIYVYNSDNTLLHFKVSKAKTYLAKTTPSSTLFEKTSNTQINLITCAGTLLGNGEATHRLIVSAQLVA